MRNRRRFAAAPVLSLRSASSASVPFLMLMKVLLLQTDPLLLLLLLVLKGSIRTLIQIYCRRSCRCHHHRRLLLIDPPTAISVYYWLSSSVPLLMLLLLLSPLLIDPLLLLLLFCCYPSGGTWKLWEMDRKSIDAADQCWSVLCRQSQQRGKNRSSAPLKNRVDHALRAALVAFLFVHSQAFVGSIVILIVKSFCCGTDRFVLVTK